MDKLIAIFNQDLVLAVVISREGETLEYEQFNEIAGFDIEIFFEEFSQRDPELQQDVTGEHEHTLVRTPIAKDDPRYLQALVQELRDQGMRAVLIDSVLKAPLLALSSEAISMTDREQILGDIMALESEDAKTFARYATELQSLLGELKQNQDEWQEFLEDKEKDLLKADN